MRLPQWDMAKLKAKAILWGGVLLFYIASIVSAYMLGAANERADQEKAKVEVLEDDRDRAVEDGLANADTAERMVKQLATLEARLAEANRRASNAINANKNRENPVCDLTDDELAGLQAIRNSYEQ